MQNKENPFGLICVICSIRLDLDLLLKLDDPWSILQIFEHSNML